MSEMTKKDSQTAFIEGKGIPKGHFEGPILVKLRRVFERFFFKELRRVNEAEKSKCFYVVFLLIVLSRY